MKLLLFLLEKGMLGGGGEGEGEGDTETGSRSFSPIGNHIGRYPGSVDNYFYLTKSNTGPMNFQKIEPSKRLSKQT